MRRPTLAACLLSLYALSAAAIEPFTVKDIRVEGLQRIEPGTVFSYLPVRVGESLDDAKAADAIKALYATGFFRDVRLETEGDVLVVQVVERPAIGRVEIVGMKEFSKDDLLKGMKEIGLAESRIFDRSLLDKAEQEMKRQYFSRGKYASQVTTTVTPLDRNRVEVRFNIDEGPAARIRKIALVGNRAFPEKTLLKEFTSTTSNWLSWLNKNDQYSRQKLSGDLESLRSYYLNRGYLEFSIDSTQVSITPDKRDIYVTVNLTEGPRYTVSDVKLAGELLVPEAELKKLIQLKPGEVFNRAQLTASTQAMGERLGDEGYAFANVNASPELDREKHTVAFTFLVDPGHRVYVRRINISGNTKTQDEVVRREMRQMESGWYSSAKIKRSKERLDRLGFFSDVNVETPAVPGTTDQVDLDIGVTERPTGSVLFGAGYSSNEGVILSASVSQDNAFGTGNRVAVQVNSGETNQVYSLSFTDPYFTEDGVSLGYDLYKRDVDAGELTALGNYQTESLGAGLRLGLPLNEMDAVNFGLSYEQTDLRLFEDSPQRFQDFVDEFGNSNSTVRLDTGWARDTRDSLLYPTKGRLQRLYGEVGLPIADLKYYKVSYQHQWFYPLPADTTLMLNGEIGLGDGYAGRPLPFYKNFYAGGNTSVRGYESGTLGPKDEDGDALGGNRRLVGNAELLFPIPGLRNDKSVRMSVFVDGGSAFGDDERVDLGELRYSTGVSFSWYSPIGPLKFSLAKALNSKPDDKTETFQFILGSTF